MPAPQAASAEATRTRLAQARNRCSSSNARAAQEERKHDTRRKIILGGLLLEAAGKERRFAEALDELMTRIQRAQDKTAFAEWSPAKPADRPDDARDPARRRSLLGSDRCSSAGPVVRERAALMDGSKAGGTAVRSGVRQPRL